MASRAQNTKRIPVELAQDGGRLMFFPEVEARVGYSKSGLRKLELARVFPKRIKLGETLVCWDAAAVIRFIDATKRHGGLPPADWDAVQQGAANESSPHL